MARKDVATTGAEPPIDHTPVDLDQQLGHLERQFSKLNDQVQSLQRLASLGTMTAVVAHEINNLLTPILSYSQYALESDDADLWRKSIERTYAGALRMQSICSGILGMSTGAKPNLTVAPIRPVIEDAIQSLGADASIDGIKMAIDVSHNLHACFDAGSLRQIIVNLSINARQAMSETGGTLRIIADSPDENTVRIRVSDTGTGIAPKDISRIFEPFFTTKRKFDDAEHRGVGLGLYICKCLIESQNGSIAVESVVGAGTTFAMTLPSAHH